MQSIRIHWFQHAPFERLELIGTWARTQDFVCKLTRLYCSDPMPSLEEFDWLVLMGGPMGANDEQIHPWLTDEKLFIEQAVAAGKIVTGICLGAQLIADVMGGRVYRAVHRELGWHPVVLTHEGQKSPVTAGLPSSFMTFHWHADTFDVPPSCVRLAASKACPNQAFAYGERVVGLQFHPEMTEAGIEEWLAGECGETDAAGPFVQTPQEIRNIMHTTDMTGGIMYQLMSNIFTANQALIAV